LTVVLYTLHFEPSIALGLLSRDHHLVDLILQDAGLEGRWIEHPVRSLRLLTLLKSHLVLSDHVCLFLGAVLSRGEGLVDLVLEGLGHLLFHLVGLAGFLERLRHYLLTFN
jgi:hypothetical protein